MEKIIGRGFEFERLSDYFESGKSEFIALYGRRRVGKTFLIRKQEVPLAKNCRVTGIHGTRWRTVLSKLT